MRNVLSHLVILVLAGLPFTSRAAQVTLANGDRLSGAIVTLADGVLVLKTAYAGDLKISWAEVQGIVSDENVSVMLKDGTLVSGRLGNPAAGLLQIESGQVGLSSPLALSAIDYLNPSQQVLGLEPDVSGRANLGFNLSEGNTSTQRAHVDAETVVRYRRSRYTLGLVFNEAEDDGSQTEYNASGHGKYDYFIAEKTYLYSNMLFTKDKFQDLSLRTSLGLGAGYQIWDTEQRSLSLEGGLSYINEDYETGADSSYPSARWSIDYKQRLFDTSVQFFHFHEGYIGLEDVNDFFFRSNTGLRIPVASHLAATAQFDLDYDNTPAPGAERQDTRYLLNIGYTW